MDVSQENTYERNYKRRSTQDYRDFDGKTLKDDRLRTIATFDGKTLKDDRLRTIAPLTVNPERRPTPNYRNI
jgi:hypothetical protein